MAAIDKIYGTTEQYDEFYAWCEANKPTLLKYFYDRDGYRKPYDRPITNFPVWVDKWLLSNCPLGWVVAAIKDQYGIDDDYSLSELINEQDIGGEV